MKKFARFLAVSFVLLAHSAIAQTNTVGLILKDSLASPGYTLFTPLSSTMTYLIDLDGQLVHSWESAYRPGQAVYLLENGHLLRAAKATNPVFGNTGGAGGLVQEFDWDGNLIWQFSYSSSQYCTHHDIEPLPNGNVLVIAWEYKTRQEAIDAGRDPSLWTANSLWPDCILEVRPEGDHGGQIVWEWHAWDHLIQDYDSTKPNFGRVEEHPELIDLNYSAVKNAGGADWLHINAVDYNPELDQILLTVHNFSEIWVIDHSTTTEEAAGHTGGRYGRGGDLLYRWGNPAAYRAGGPADRQLFGPHDAHWIPKGLPGEGHILIFNNGAGRPDGQYSTVEEIVPPVDTTGNYVQPESGGPFLPASPIWRYRSSIFAQNISGVQRMPNGNTLICYGPQGTFEEITPDGKVVWKYVNPVDRNGPVPQGTPAQNLRNNVFKIRRYPLDYPAFAGKDLSPKGPIEITTGVKQDPVTLPSEEGLTAYPNPFNSSVTLVFRLREPGKINLSVYDVRGRKLAEIAEGSYAGGTHVVRWEAERLPSGSYFVVLNTERGKYVRKVLLIR